MGPSSMSWSTDRIDRDKYRFEDAEAVQNLWVCEGLRVLRITSAKDLVFFCFQYA